MIHVETTPNPLTLKFILSNLVSEEPLEINNKAEAKISFLADDLFKIEGVKRIFLGRDFVAVTVQNASSWKFLQPQIQACIQDYDDNDLDILNYNELSKVKRDPSNPGSSDSIENQIKELIDERIRPAVAMDGGNVEFKRFENGIVYLKMMGACAGCPSASITLKHGIENMIRYFIPEVIEVRAIED